jgi:vancomycin resistance protein YoaR
VADAYYDAATKTVVEEVRGYGFDLAAANQQIALGKPGETITITMAYTEPTVTKAQLEEQLFGNLLHAVSSPYVNNANRTTNLRLACEAINGTILNPGDVFSFNEIVGERTAEKGYKGATVYVSGGASESQLGGGICQVASTIYYGTLHLDLEQVQREPHMYAVTYVPMGMDAAIYWDIGQDYKFRNTNSNPMKVMAWLENGKVNIEFYGIAENSNTIKMTYEVLETYPYEEVEKVDETKPVGYRQETTTPYTGYKVVTYKTIFDAEGNEISHDIEAYSTYKKRDRVFTVGPVEEDPWGDDPFWDTPDEDDEPWYDPFTGQWYDPNE